MTKDEIIQMARESGLPTAWISESGIVQWAQLERFAALVEAKASEKEREWIGLTDEEIDEWTPEIHAVIRAIEAKLKAKNERKEKNQGES